MIENSSHGENKGRMLLVIPYMGSPRVFSLYFPFWKFLNCILAFSCKEKKKSSTIRTVAQF